MKVENDQAAESLAEYNEVMRVVRDQLQKAVEKDKSFASQQHL